MKKTLGKITIALAAILMTVTAVFVVPDGDVAASSIQDVTPAETATAREDRVKAKLEKQYNRLQVWSDRQAENITKLDDLAEKFQDRLENLMEKGIEITALETAISSFTARLPEIKDSHNAAATILDAHAGFDADGKVTDITTARSTLENARTGLKETRGMMKDAAKTLRNAVRDFRDTHPLPTPSSTATPTD